MADMTKDDPTDSSIVKSAYIWNSIGSLINAFQSVIILVFLTRLTTLEDAGIFTLAFANANLFLNLGKFGMRNYQASDVLPHYSFDAYRKSRFITCVLMVFCGVCHLLLSAQLNDYTLYKSLCIFTMILLKTTDAVEDVYNGAFQQEGRLDISGKQMTLRMCLMIAAFIIGAALTKNLVTATLIAFAVSLGVLLLSLSYIAHRYELPHQYKTEPNKTCWSLLRECTPLFISAFLLFYIGNAPKYAIDTHLSDVAQAQYGFIAMPVFVVSLFAQFVYMPLVEPLSEMWVHNERRRFVSTISKQVLIIAGITAVCVGGAALLGVPVLSAFYNTDLSPFKLELSILVLGGGFLALASLFTMGITVMRKQRSLTIGYIAVTVFAYFSSDIMVKSLAIRGAAYAYICCMLILSAWFAALFYHFTRK